MEYMPFEYCKPEQWKKRYFFRTIPLWLWNCCILSKSGGCKDEVTKAKMKTRIRMEWTNGYLYYICATALDSELPNWFLAANLQIMGRAAGWSRGHRRERVNGRPQPSEGREHVNFGLDRMWGKGWPTPVGATLPVPHCQCHANRSSVCLTVVETMQVESIWGDWTTI